MAVVAGLAVGAAAIQAVEASPDQALAERPAVALASLPTQAQRTYRLILQGGPFPYDKDGTVFGNRERQLPSRARGYYREYTVKTPHAAGRGGRRIICGGTRPLRELSSHSAMNIGFEISESFHPRRTATMELQTIRPNLVQSIRAYRVDDLMQAAADAGQHFLYANLATAQSKQEVLDGIAQAFLFPAHFGKNLDALYDCMTDLVHKAGQQPGFVVVLEQLPDGPRFDREAREQLLEVFRDAAEYWGERRIPFRCFYSFR
jgi:guanyl-specific ribonuclease Sa/RNAse (barnase) inhibitor barstar